MTKKVDICSISYNEELLLPTWIESWLSIPWINKINIVDGGSTDKSLEICKSYDRVNIIVVPWKNDFAKQRNLAIKLARSDWLIQPDIDEIPCANLSDERLQDCLSRQDINQIMLPYIKFYDWNTMWSFNNGNTPTIENDVVKFGFKSTITIFKKGHLAYYSKSLHEMPVFSGKENYMHLWQSSKLEELKDKFLIGHYDQAKHFGQANANNTSVEFEMGIKRVRYRLISDAVYDGKTYTKEWALQALEKLKNGDRSMIEDLGRKQLDSFLREHTISNYSIKHLNNQILKSKMEL